MMFFCGQKWQVRAAGVSRHKRTSRQFPGGNQSTQRHFLCRVIQICKYLCCE